MRWLVLVLPLMAVTCGGGGSFCTTAVLQVPPDDELVVLERAPETVRLLDDNNLKGLALSCPWAAGYGR